MIDTTGGLINDEINSVYVYISVSDKHCALLEFMGILLIFKTNNSFQVEIIQSSSNELSLSAGQFTVSGCPSAAGTLICSINGSKVPVPVMAIGILAITFNAAGKNILAGESFKVGGF